MTDDTPAPASGRVPFTSPSKASASSPAVQTGSVAPGANGTPVQDKPKRQKPALSAAGVPVVLDFGHATNERGKEKEAEKPDTSNDALLAQMLAAGHTADQTPKPRRPPQSERKAASPSAVTPPAVAAIVHADANGEADDGRDMSSSPADSPTLGLGLDSDEYCFSDVKDEKENGRDMPLAQSLIRLGTTVISTAGLPDRTVLRVNLIAQKSRVRARAARDAIIPAIDLLELDDNPAVSGADIFTACTYAQIVIGKTLPKTAKTHAGFQGSEADPLVEVQLMLRFAATFEPAAVRTSLPPFDGEYKYSECTERCVASKVVAHLHAIQNHMVPISHVAASLHGLLQTRNSPGHSVEFGKLALSAFTLGPLAHTTKQAEVTALTAPICSAAVPLLIRCEGKAMDKALFIIPSRYAAPETVRQPRANGAKQAYKNIFSQAVSVNNKHSRLSATERHGFEALANLFLTRLRFPAHFQYRKLVRKRVCARCLGADHPQTKCKSKPICRNCCAENCTDNCPHPPQCGICGRAHRTTACPEYRGVYADPTEEYDDLPPRPPGTGKAMNIQSIPQALQAASQAQLLAALTQQVTCWEPEKGSNDQVWQLEAEEPAQVQDTWRQLTPTTVLLKVANATRRVARMSGGKLPSWHVEVPPNAELAKQWIAKVNQIESKLLDMALTGASNTDRCSRSDIPAPHEDLRKAGLTVENSWEYKPPQQLALIDATPPRIEPNGRSNRNGRGKGRDNPPKKKPCAKDD